ncbi:MAG: hypothetical protein KDC74_13280 [Flavobacteriaceae bacterium]|nr:hypothetical protein [Flavobacteriaceae bacterium]
MTLVLIDGIKHKLTFEPIDCKIGRRIEKVLCFKKELKKDVLVLSKKENILCSSIKLILFSDGLGV